ncbi:MAG: DUF4830 domain-containing protein [Butyricicoccus sp.]|nr:DUF4830 domain-containing protein [Butyricicoccus pullicaecorum]
MVMYTTKLTRRKIVVGFLALCALVVGTGYGLFGGRAEDAASAAAETSISCKLEGNEDRVSFLRSYGWEVEESPAAEQEVRIPDTFDAAYESYNALQKTQGLDLTKYQGRKCKLYVYRVHNDPSGEQGVTANLVLYRNRLIAADICSEHADGFVRAVTDRSASGQQTEE